MPAPSPLVIATQSVQRLVKEDTYYRKELTQQSERVKKLETDLNASGESADGNAAFMLKQEVRFISFAFSIRRSKCHARIHSTNPHFNTITFLLIYISRPNSFSLPSPTS